MYQGTELISSFVPSDSCRQTSSIQMLERFFHPFNFKIVMDLGCGKGDTVDYFRQKIPGVRWVGLDILTSQEVNQRTRKDAEFITYNGVNIPFNDNFFDLIYCHQVFEHVEKPQELMFEVGRILKAGGFLIGSTSHLEAFHSLSTFNYTPYGFNLLLKDTSLNLIELRPGIDFLTLLFTRLMNRVPLAGKLASRYFIVQSPFNSLIEFIMKLKGSSYKDINLVKLLFCGQFSFVAQKNNDVS